MTCCDFCGANLERLPSRRFVQNPPHMAVIVNICEECVGVCVTLLADKANERISLPDSQPASIQQPNEDPTLPSGPL